MVTDSIAKFAIIKPIGIESYSSTGRLPKLALISNSYPLKSH